MKPHATPPSLSPLSPKDHSAALQNPFRNSLAKASPLITAINRNSRTKAQPPKRSGHNRTRTISCEQDPEHTYEINRNGNSKDLPNRIKVISGLDSFRKLQILDLSHNTIEKMENLSKLINLMSLNLSYNKISKFENISTLKNLEILDLSNNLIEEIPPMIEANYNLSELRISSNLISTSQSIYSLQKLEKLVILDMSNNPITSIYDYPFLIKLNLKKLYYLDGKIVSRAVGKTPKEHNQSIHMIDHASSISRYSGISNQLYPPGSFLDGEKPPSSQHWFDEMALSSRSRMTMMSVGSVKNQDSYMGYEQSQRSTVNAGKRLSSFGSAEPVEMEASQLSQFYFTNLPAFEIEKNTGKLKSSQLFDEKENSTIEHSYNTDGNKPNLTVDVQTPRLDELLQLNGTAKDVEKVKKNSSQIDTLFQTTKDIRGFLNKIRKDKGQENKSFIKDHYSRKGDESDNGSVSTSPIRTPTNNEGMKISGTFQRELFGQKQQENDGGVNVDELKKFTNEKVDEWNKIAKEIDSQKTATLTAVNYLENMMANAADELENMKANTHPSHDLLKEVTELIPTTREFFDALDRLHNYQKAYLRVSQIELGQPEGPKTLEEKRTNLKELFENLNWMRHKVLELVSKILNLEISVISKQVNTPTSHHKRGVLKELTVFDPFLNDIIPKFHKVKKDHELQIQILTQIHQKYQGNSDVILTLPEKKSLSKAELSHNRKISSTENIANKENVNDVNLPKNPTERFNQSPVLTVRKENTMNNTSKNNEGGRYEITYTEETDQKFNEKSMLTARTSLRLEGVRNSNSMDSGHFFTKRNKGCALRQSDSIMNLDGNTTRKNAVRESIPTDLVIHDVNSSQSSALKDKRRESWGAYKQEIAKLNAKVQQLQREKEQDTQTIQVLQELCNVNMLKLDEMRNKVNSAVEKSLTASQNPLVWVMQAQTTIMEGLVQQNKQLQEKINTMAFTYNPTVQTIGSICSISESETQEKSQPENPNDKLNTDLSSIHQRSEAKTDKNLLSDNKSPPPRPREDENSKSENKNFERKVSINLDSLNSYTDAKERKAQDSNLTSGTSLKKKKKSKEFTFKREGSDRKSPNPLEQPNTQEFSIRNKLSFERGEGVSYSMSSINNSESKAGKDFQHVSLQKSSLKIPRLQHETSKKGLGLEGILYEIADNEVATQTDEVEYAIGSQTDRLRDTQESISPSKRLLTEPVPVTSSSQGFNEAGRAYFNHSNLHENIAQYFKERVQTLANNKIKKINPNICQYKSLKDKIIERTGKEIKRSTSGSGNYIQRRDPSGNPRTPTAHHYPLPIPSSWANVSPMTQKDKISFEPKSVGKGSCLRSSSTKAQGGMSVNRPAKKGSSISKLPTGLPKKKILNLPEAEFYDNKFDFESPHHPFFVSLTQKAQHRTIKSSSSQANLLANYGASQKRSFVTCPDEF